MNQLSTITNQTDSKPIIDRNSDLFQGLFMYLSLSATLKVILDDRKQTEWGLGLGIPKSIISPMFVHNKYPADKHLRKIMLAENASLSALWGASSAPFMIHRSSSSKETYEMLEKHLEDHNWQVYLVTGDEFPVVVLATEAMAEIDDLNFEYKQIETICGPLDHACANLFRELVVKHVEVPKDEAHALATGYKGTYYLFGQETLTNAKVITQNQVNSIFCERTDRNAALLKRVMEILDEALVESKIEVSDEDRRKIVSELYTYAIEQGLEAEKSIPEVANSMLRVI